MQCFLPAKGQEDGESNKENEGNSAKPISKSRSVVIDDDFTIAKLSSHRDNPSKLPEESINEIEDSVQMQFDDNQQCTNYLKRKQKYIDNQRRKRQRMTIECLSDKEVLEDDQTSINQSLGQELNEAQTDELQKFTGFLF